MHPDPQMTILDLIKQLTTYADAITAFSVVQGLAFCFAVAQGEGFAKAVWRKQGTWAATIGIVVGSCLYCQLVNMCMAGVDRLQNPGGTNPSTETASKGTKVIADAITSVTGHIQTTRLSLIGLSGLMSLFALWATRLDPPQDRGVSDSPLVPL